MGHPQRQADETANSYHRAGHSLVVSGDLEKAEKLLRRSMGIFTKIYGPTNKYVVDVVTDLVRVLRKLDRHDEANLLLKGVIENKIELTPNGPLLFAQRANLFASDEKWKEASESYRRSISLLEELQKKSQEQTQATNKSPLSSSYNSLAWSLATHPKAPRENASRAVEIAKKAVELSPKTETFRNTLGVAYYREGDWKAGLEDLEKSNQKLKGLSSGINEYFLAMIHWKLGNEVEAKQYFDRSTEWMQKKMPKNAKLIQFHAEAAHLLEITLPSESPVEALKPSGQLGL